jgi:ABC-type molybdate transport system substrate-binding protein
MTLPTDIFYTLPTNYKDDPEGYLTTLTFQLQNMYEQIVQNVNGSFRNDAVTASNRWTPTLSGSTPGTFTYTHQYGWSLRQGIMNELWGDIAWSSTTASGNLQLDLPYLVTLSNGLPFLGEVQSSGITYTGGTHIVLNANQNEFIATFYNTGSAFTTAPQAVVASGRVIFHIRYIGISDE